MGFLLNASSENLLWCLQLLLVILKRYKTQTYPSHLIYICTCTWKFSVLVAHLPRTVLRIIWYFTNRSVSPAMPVALWWQMSFPRAAPPTKTKCPVPSWWGTCQPGLRHVLHVTESLALWLFLAHLNSSLLKLAVICGTVVLAPISGIYFAPSN